MPTKKKTPSFQDLSQELDEVVAQLQLKDVDIDDAVRLYERGQILIRELQAYLKTAETKVKKLKLKE